jgi:ribosomal protein S18 acetylase RimI-like enzyme
MLSYRPANPEQYETFFNLMVEQSNEYIRTTLQLMGADLTEFGQLFRTVGEVYGIDQDGELAGFYWVELREKVLHLHGLILRPEFQGQGIGKEVLDFLERQYSERIEAIELGVHRSNQRAIALYEKQGYQTVRTFDDLGFYVMQKRPDKKVNRDGEKSHMTGGKG